MILFSILRLTAGQTAGQSAGCGGELPVLPQPGHHQKMVVAVSDPQQGEVRREFYLHLPAHYVLTNTRPVPLVVDYHWWGGSASSQVSDYPWPHLADTDSTPFIYLALQVPRICLSQSGKCLMCVLLSRTTRKPSLINVWAGRWVVGKLVTTH